MCIVHCAMLKRTWINFFFFGDSSLDFGISLIFWFWFNHGILYILLSMYIILFNGTQLFSSPFRRRKNFIGKKKLTVSYNHLFENMGHVPCKDMQITLQKWLYLHERWNNIFHLKWNNIFHIRLHAICSAKI